MKNPLDSDGKVSRCRICDSKFRCANKWPDKYYFQLHDKIESIFFQEATDSLLAETLNITTIDSGCTKIVCGEVWLQYYIGSLSDSDKDKINIDRSKIYFKFDNSKIVRSNRPVMIPVFNGGMQNKLTIDIIDYDISLLLSKDSMRKVNEMINFKNDEIIMFHKTVDIIHTDSGHCGILLNSLIKKDKFINRQISYFCSYLKIKSQDQK